MYQYWMIMMAWKKHFTYMKLSDITIAMQQKWEDKGNDTLMIINN